MGLRVPEEEETPVQSPLQTACEWTRVTNWRFYEDGSEGTVVRYQPGRVSVEYRREEDGPPRIERVLIYTRHDDPRRRKLKKSLAAISPQMRGIVARIVRENERACGRFAATILLPNGESIHA